MILERIADLPRSVLYKEIDGELPDGVEVDFLFITPTLKIHKYFIIIKRMEVVNEHVHQKNN